MLSRTGRLALTGLTAIIAACASMAYAGGDEDFDTQSAHHGDPEDRARRSAGIQVGPRPFERADLPQGASKAGFYYLFDPLGQAVKKDSDMYKALDVLARKVGILGIFSDWPATVTYYASCMGLN